MLVRFPKDALVDSNETKTLRLILEEANFVKNYNRTVGVRSGTPELKLSRGREISAVRAIW